jgi:hypothetical protein
MFGYEVHDGLSMEEVFHGRLSFFEQEVSLARDFVLKSAKAADEPVRCPVCGAHLNSAFFEKWGVAYFLCVECWTTFAPALPEEVRGFENNSSLTVLRRSEEFQDKTRQSREILWRSLIKWIEQRVRRYTDAPLPCRALIRGVRHTGLLELLRAVPLFLTIDVKGSIITPDHYDENGYDAAFCLDTLQRRTDPSVYLRSMHGLLLPGGLFFLNTRVGTGFDLLTLKGRAETVFPYEHIFLPSVKSLTLLLEKAGFIVLEASTPGMFDVAHVYKQRDALDESDLFARFLASEYNERMFSDFQKFLQKHGLSSTVRVVARKA